MTTTAIVTAINLFPVRSCAGESVQQANITPNGLMFDRNWRLVEPSGRFLTQREVPTMALIKPHIVGLQLQMSFGCDVERILVQGEDTSLARINISATSEGIDQGDAVADWLHRVLGVEARLLRVTNNSSGSEITLLPGEDFARPDMSPVLVISEESLADLNTRLEVPVLMNRFRPNIVIRGGSAYEEESWTRVVIGNVVYEASTELCGRCSMINIDQEKGERTGKEPLKTLATYRRVPGAVIFGKYMVPTTTGIVRVNDSIKMA